MNIEKYAEKDGEGKTETPAVFDQNLRSALSGNPTEIPVPQNILQVDQSMEDKTAAIQSQIADRVAVLKKAGQWNITEK